MIDWWNRIEFLNPELFWLLLLLPVAIVWYIWTRKKQQAQVHISSVQGFATTGSLLSRCKPIIYVFRWVALGLIITALARPQSTDVTTKSKTTQGIDIVLTVDVSASMLAQDLKPNRLEATKKVAQDFVRRRPDDRIGVVVYAGESYTKTPITTDEVITLKAIESIEFDGVLENGTAIGMGLATAVNRLKDSKALSRVIILMTDGMNNTGQLDPKIASELALEYGIKVYTIGIGRNGNAPSPIPQIGGSFIMRNMPVEIDEDLMKEIADKTGGKYYRATDNKKLQEIYAEIDQLEKTEVEEFKFVNKQEEFRILLLIALALVALEQLLRFTLFRTIA
jgi:Ca-activated chloride channel family protein